MHKLPNNTRNRQSPGMQIIRNTTRQNMLHTVYIFIIRFAIMMWCVLIRAITQKSIMNRTINQWCIGVLIGWCSPAHTHPYKKLSLKFTRGTNNIINYPHNADNHLYSTRVAFFLCVMGSWICVRVVKEILYVHSRRVNGHWRCIAGHGGNVICAFIKSTHFARIMKQMYADGGCLRVWQIHRIMKIPSIVHVPQLFVSGLPQSFSLSLSLPLHGVPSSAKNVSIYSSSYERPRVLHDCTYTVSERVEA